MPVPIPPPPVLPPPTTPSFPQSSRPSSIPPSRWLPQPQPQWQTWTQTTVNEFTAGTGDNVTVVDVGGGDGTVILATSGESQGYYLSLGTLESSSHDCGRPAEFGTISWDSQAPGGTKLKFQIATNNNNSTWNFVGPGGSPMTYYKTSGANIWSGHDGHRYIKYRAYFGTTNPAQTPKLEEVRITYR